MVTDSGSSNPEESGQPPETTLRRSLRPTIDVPVDTQRNYREELITATNKRLTEYRDNSEARGTHGTRSSRGSWFSNKTSFEAPEVPTDLTPEQGEDDSLSPHLLAPEPSIAIHHRSTTPINLRDASPRSVLSPPSRSVSPHDAPRARSRSASPRDAHRRSSRSPSERPSRRGSRMMMKRASSACGSQPAAPTAVYAAQRAEAEKADKLAAERREEHRRQLITEEESSMRTSAEIHQIWCYLDEVISLKPDLPSIQRQPTIEEKDKPYLRHFRNAVNRVLSHNRTWLLQLNVQRLVNSTVGVGKAEKDLPMKTRQDVLKSVQDGRVFWENIASAGRQTTMMVCPGNRLEQRFYDEPEEPHSPRPYATLQQAASRSWPHEVRVAGGLRPCPGTADGVASSKGYSNYIDLLMAEQDRLSAASKDPRTTSLSSQSYACLKHTLSLETVMSHEEAHRQSHDSIPGRSILNVSQGLKDRSASHGSRVATPKRQEDQLRSNSVRGSEVPSSAECLSARATVGLRSTSKLLSSSVNSGTPRSHLHSAASMESASLQLPQVPAVGSGNTSKRPSRHLVSTGGGAKAVNSNSVRLPDVNASAHIDPNVKMDVAAMTIAGSPRPSRARCHVATSPRTTKKALFVDRLPPTAILEGAPMRRRGQARIWSEFSNDRILSEVGSDLPWEPPEENESRPEVLYFRGCDELNIMPSKKDFLIDPTSVEIDLSNAGLTDEQLRALGKAMGHRNSNLQVLDLSGNHLLTDSSLQGTLERLATQVSGIRVLRLGGTQLGSASVKVLAQAMISQFAIEDLSLQSVPVPDSTWPALCNAVMRSHLQTLDLSDTQCGRWKQQSGIQLAQTLTGANFLKNVDISNNYFRRSALEALGIAIGHSRFRLEVLALNDNAWSDCEAALAGGSSSPLVYFCERIRTNKSLRRLELSRSQVNVMAAYCLEDASLGHPCLQELILQGNPLGEQGLRAILRALLSAGSQLKNILVTDLRDMNLHPPVLFNYGDLTEDYIGPQALFMDNAYHRAIMRLILRRTEDFQQPPLACLQGFKIDGQRCTTCPFKKQNLGLWTVPASGKLEFSLLLDVPLGASSAQEYLLNWQQKRRVPVSVGKFMYLHRTWLSMPTDDQRRLFVNALAKEIMLKLGHLRTFADEVRSSMPNLLSVVISALSLAIPEVHRACINSALLPSVNFYKNKYRKAERTRTREIQLDDSYSIPAELRPRKEVMMWLKRLFHFNPGNPNGRYKLLLTDPIDFTVAERLILVDAWAVKRAEQLNLRDFSQYGSYTGVRNFTVNGSPVQFTPHWQLPGDGYSGEGTVCLNYVTPLRPTAAEKPMSEDMFDHVRTIFRKDVRELVRFAVLRLISHRLMLSASQVAEILGTVEDADLRQDLYCILFCRCVDFGPPLIDIYAGVLGDSPGLGLFSPEQRHNICSRLGATNTFDWHHISDPPFNRYSLDLSAVDDRRLLQLVLELDTIEPGYNLVHSHWTGHGVTVSASGADCIPAEWHHNPPDYGVFDFTFVVEKPHYARMQARHRLGRDMGWLCGEPPPEIPEAKRRLSPVPMDRRKSPTSVLQFFAASSERSEQG